MSKSRFLSETDATLDHAIDALREVAARYGMDAAGRVVAEALHGEWERTWMRLQGVEPCGDYEAIGRFQKEVGNPRLDHQRFWSKGGQIVVTDEEYSLDLEAMKRLGSFCRRRDLACFVDPLSMHFPTGCLLVRIGPPGAIENSAAKRVLPTADARERPTAPVRVGPPGWPVLQGARRSGEGRRGRIWRTRRSSVQVPAAARRMR